MQRKTQTCNPIAIPGQWAGIMSPRHSTTAPHNSKPSLPSTPGMQNHPTNNNKTKPPKQSTLWNFIQVQLPNPNPPPTQNQNLINITESSTQNSINSSTQLNTTLLESHKEPLLPQTQHQ